MSDPTQPIVPPEPPRAPDPARQFALDQLRAQENLPGALLAGLGGALAGAAVWAAVTVATGYQIGIMAVGIGFLVGYAVRLVGKGVSQVFGWIGAGLSLLGCASGNLLALCAMVAREHGIALADVLAGLDASLIRELMIATFSPMDLLFYGIAVYEGYRLSFRQLGEQERSALEPGR
jgi:hypothetical protein